MSMVIYLYKSYLLVFVDVYRLLIMTHLDSYYNSHIGKWLLIDWRLELTTHGSITFNNSHIGKQLFLDWGLRTHNDNS